MTVEEALDRALDDIRYDGVSVEQCLHDYPEHADKLRPLLRNATRLAETPEVRPNRQFKARLRKEFAPPKRSLFGRWSLSFVLLLVFVITSIAIWLGMNWDNSYAVNQLLPKLPMLKVTSAHALQSLVGEISLTLAEVGQTTL